MVESAIGYSEMRGMQAKHMRSIYFFFFFQKYQVRCPQWLDVCIDAGSRLIAYNLLRTEYGVHYLTVQ